MTSLWQSIWTEQELMDLYKLSAQQVASLRARGLPYIAVNATTRLYEENATIGFLAGLSRTAERKPRKAKVDAA